MMDDVRPMDDGRKMIHYGFLMLLIVLWVTDDARWLMFLGPLIAVGARRMADAGWSLDDG